jgi:hypothetical protein
MLTPFVIALACANGMTAACLYPLAALIAVLPMPEDQIFFDTQVLTLGEHKPTRFAGRAGGPGRPADISGVSKEELHELPSAA